MEKDDAQLIDPEDAALALGLLTRLPVELPNSTRTSALSAWVWPLVGVVIAGVASLVGMGTFGLGLGTQVAAVLTLSALVILTGALHEDGLADCADSLGGWDSAARLQIMKDSHIGAYGAIALILSLMIRAMTMAKAFSLGVSVAVPAILVAGALSRAAMAAVMTALPHARKTGLSHSVGRVPRATAALACSMALLIALALTGWGGLWSALVVGGVTWGVAAGARILFGGQTGDVLGATQQLTEIATLLVLTTFA